MLFFIFRLGLWSPGLRSHVFHLPLSCRFAVMACCWALDPEERPKFQQLVQCLTEFHAALGAYVWNCRRRLNSLIGRRHGIHLQLHASLGLTHVMCIKQHQREKALLPKHCALECFSSLKFFVRPLDVEYFLDITFAKLNWDLFICHQDF